MGECVDSGERDGIYELGKHLVPPPLLLSALGDPETEREREREKERERASDRERASERERRQAEALSLIPLALRPLD